MAGPHRYQKGHPKFPGAGIKKGGHHKVSQRIIKSFLDCYDQIGGDKAFQSWAKENQTEFYKFYSKMLPANVQLLDDQGLPSTITFTVTSNHESD